MLRAYRLVYPENPHAPEQLWEWQQPHISRLLLNARTFERRVVQCYFSSWEALATANCGIWQRYYRACPLYDHVAGWEAWMVEYREILDDVQELYDIVKDKRGRG